MLARRSYGEGGLLGDGGDGQDLPGVGPAVRSDGELERLGVPDHRLALLQEGPERGLDSLVGYVLGERRGPAVGDHSCLQNEKKII